MLGCGGGKGRCGEVLGSRGKVREGVGALGKSGKVCWGVGKGVGKY